MRRKILSFVYIFSVFLVNPIIGVTWGPSTRRPRALPKRFSLRDHSLTRKMWISRAWILFHPFEPHKLKKIYIMYAILIFCLLLRFLLQKQGESLVYLRWLEFLFLLWRTGSAPTTPPCSVTTFCYFKPRPFWNSLEIIWLSQVLCESIQEVFVMLKIIPCIHGEHFSHWHRFLFCTAIMRNKQSKAKTVYCSVKNSN